MRSRNLNRTPSGGRGGAACAAAFGIDGAEWSALRSQRPNALVIGPTAVIDPFLDALLPTRS